MDWESARKICLSVARRYAKTASQAEDMAQNAVIRAWRNQEKLLDPERQKQWLFQIARNEALRELERRIPDPMEPSEYEAEEDRELLAIVDGSSIWGVLSALSTGERELIKLRYEEDMTQSAIAEQLGIPEGTVKVRLHRVREKLRSMPGIQ